MLKKNSWKNQLSLWHWPICMITKYIPQESRKLIKSHKLASWNVIIVYSGTYVSKGDGFFLSAMRDFKWASLLTSRSARLSSYRKDRRTGAPLLEIHASKDQILYSFAWAAIIKYHRLTVQSLSHVHLFATPWAAARQASLSFTTSQSLLKLMSIESVMPSSHLILCRPLLLLPSIFPSIRVFSNKSVLYIRWPKYWSFSFSISPSNEYSWLISFRMDWFDLLAVQVTQESAPVCSKALILLCSAFFMVQLSHTHMATGNTIALTRRSFVGKVVSAF